MVDNKVLLELAQEVMGGPLDRLDAAEEGAFSLSAFLLSLWLSGAPEPLLHLLQSNLCQGFLDSTAVSWTAVCESVLMQDPEEGAAP